MAERIFLDTNVWLDYLDSKRDRHQSAVALMAVLRIRKKDFVMTTSESVLTTLAYFLPKKFGYKETCRILSDHLNMCMVISTGNIELLAALAELPKDIEDRILETIAIQNGVQIIITNDLDGFGFHPQVTVYQPLHFLAAIV